MQPDADAIRRAFDAGTMLPAPLSADPAFDLDAAYAVEAELVRLRRAEGRRTAGLKIGFANRAVWRALKLETLVWAHVYDHTVHHAADNRAALAIGGRIAPKIEPEVVLRLAGPIAPGGGAAEALAAVNGMALGFEIIDCPFPGWTFQPADLVAASGFHVALVIGRIRAVTAGDIPALVDALAQFTVTLTKDGAVAAEGAGKNVLKSPALCLAELASAIARRSGAEPLAAGDVVTTGSLTAPQPIAAGEEWRAEVSGLDLPALTLRFTS